MACGLPIMQAYRPVSTPTTIDSVTPTTAVSRPAPQYVPEEWIRTAEAWSRIHAWTTEHCRRHQLERLAEKKARETLESGETRESVPIPRTTMSFHPAPACTEGQHAAWIEEAKIWSRDLAQRFEQREMRERAHARTNAQVAELVFYRKMWLMLCAGLVISAFLFLILFIGVL